ncbi:MAG: ATP-binding protein [Oscillospiraceae bacterium]|jgi:signal transduction histidine kinase|nr:ATP-binding protein [Oscillospiraceae bacterium]MDD3260900.1 ATP-binding protein [Oscillospiraceae bacterium]
MQVQDNGIAESEIPHIFERFYRVEKSRNTKRGGSGLGLAITKGLINELGGKITVKSRLHSGSTFTIQFPLLQQSETQQPLLLQRPC